MNTGTTKRCIPVLRLEKLYTGRQVSYVLLFVHPSMYYPATQAEGKETKPCLENMFAS